jgi:hypothetical protein
MLIRVGISVFNHRTMSWPDDKKDTEWIAECANYDWVILSGDKSIEKVPEERQAVIDGKCKVFMFEDSDKTITEDWAASLVIARKRIAEIITKTDGPFFLTIKPCRVSGHIGEPRFVTEAGGGWKAPEEIQTPPEPAPAPPSPHHHSRQTTFTFADKAAD